MDAIVVIAAFFFAIFMCLGIILMKWIISQLGVTLFVLVLFLMVAIFLLAMGDEKYGDE
jgi:uncharacterized membrane protein YhaH (DUF805 family)